MGTILHSFLATKGRFTSPLVPVQNNFFYTYITLKKAWLYKTGLFVFLLLITCLFFATISYGQITQVAGSPQSNTTTGTAFTIPRPSGLAVGDVMIANIVQSDNDNNTLSNASSIGWTLIDGIKIGQTGNDEWWGTLLYKVAVAADVSAANFTFTLDADANGDGSVGAIIAYRGVDVTGGFNAAGAANSGPFDVAPGTINTSGNISTVTASTITTATNNAAVIMFGLLGDNRTFNNGSWQTATGPLVLTELYDVPYNAPLDNGIGAAWAIKTIAGNTGAGTATLNNNARNGGILIALKPKVAPPTITSLAALTGCVGGTITINGTNLTGATPTNVTIGGTAVTSIVSNTGTQLVAVIGAGTTGTVSVTTLGGTATSIATFTVNSTTITGSLDASSISICLGTVVTFTVNPATFGAYIFSVNGFVVQNGASPFYSTSTLTGGELVTVEVFANFCSATFTAPTVIVNTAQTPTLIATETSGTADDNIICAGATVNFSVIPAGASNYTFKVNGGAVQSGASNTLTSTTLNNGDQVTVDVTYANGCIGTSSAEVFTVNALPTGTFTASATAICQNDNITFTALPNTFSSYEFKQNGTTVQGPNGLNTYSTTTLPNATPVTVTVINGSGCVAIFAPLVITVNALPVVSAASQVCIGSTIIISPTSGGTWVSSNNAIATVTNAGVVTGVTAGSATFTFTQTGTLCSSTTSAVTVNALPIVSAASQVCIGSTITISPTSGGTWVSSDNAIATVTNAGVVTGVTAGSVTFTFTQSGTGCSSTTSAVTVNALPVVSAASQVCIGSTIIISPTSGGTWVSSNNAIATVTNAGVVTGVTAGSATFTFTQTGTLCSSTTSAVTVNALPIVSAASQVCIGSTITISPTSGGTWVSSNNAIATVTNAGVVTGVTAGSATFTFTQSGTGCSSTTSAVTVNALPVVSAASQVCIGSTITISPTSGGTWVSSDNAIATVTNAGVVTGVTAGSVTFTFTQSGTGCSSTTSAVTVNALPVVSAASQVCIGSTITISPTSGGTWVSSDNAIATVTNAGVVTGVTAGSVTFTFTQSGTGCSSTTSAVTVNALPVVSAASQVCIGSTIIISPTSGGTWVSSDNAIATVTNAGVVTGVTAGSVTFTFTQSGTGCSSTTSAVTVNALPVVSAASQVCIGSTIIISPTSGGTWVSSNNAIATVTNAGVVTGVTAGSVTFTFTNTTTGCSSTTSAVTVNALPVVSAASQVCIGSTIIISPTSGGTWVSSNNAIATVTNAGVVTGVTAGSATFTFTQTGTLCSSTTSAVTVNALPIVSAASQVCIGSTITISPTSGGTWVSSDNAIATVTNAGVVTGVTAGSVTFTFTQSGTGCSSTTSAVTVNALPVVSAASQVCIGSTIIISPTSGGTWVSSNNAIATVTNAGVVTGVTAGSATFTFTQTGTLCSSTTSAVTVNALPIVSAASQVCIGSTITISPTSGGTWVSSNNAIATVTNAGVVTGVTAGSATFTFTQSGTGCSSTTSAVTVNALPVVSAASQVCIGSTITISPTSGGTWVSSDNAIATVTNAGVVTGVTAGSVTFTFTQSGTGCSSTTSAVTVNALPVVSAASQVCIGSTITISPTSGGTWVSSDNAIATVTNAGVVTGVTAGSVTFTFTQSGTGCSSTTSAVTVNALPVVSAASQVCIGSTIIISPTSGGTWVSSNNAIATVTNAGVVTGVTAGSATFTFTQTGTLCSSTTSAVTVNALPVLNPITGITPVCVNSTITLLNSTSGGVWTSSNLLIATVNSSTGVVTGVSGGTVTITYTYTNSNGCISSVFTTVTVNVLPVPTLSGPNPICPGSTATYTTEPGKSNYIWVVTNGTLQGGGTNTDNTITIFWNMPGIKNITVNYTDGNGCTGAVSATINNVPSPDLPVIAGPSIVCEGSTGNVYTTQTGNSESNYVWVINGGTITSGGGINDYTATVTWTSGGARSISVNFDNINGCRASSPTVWPVTVNPLTGATSFTAGATTVCQDAADETYTATAANSTGIVYSVSPGTAGTINATTGLMDWAAAFSGAATITATSTGLCGTTTANRIVTVNPSTGVTSFTAGATTVCQDAADETYTATAANSTGIVYSVSPGTAGTINATTGLMDWAAAFSGAATITATSTGLCGTTTANRIVTVNPSTGVTSFTAGATTVCQDAADETYTATAANSTGIVYSVSPGTAGTINATTGLMDWAAAFSGAATITATSTGLCGTTTANRIVTVNPSTGVTSFTAGATTVCQDAADETYTATAANSTGIVYSVSPGTAGTINATTGLMDWAAAFSGAATITATSTGLCGTTTANRIVTVNPSTGVTSFTAGATTVCQDAADETYTATAANSTGIVYSVSPGTAGTINATTGLMDWAAAFSGAATITATSTGLCGTTTANRIVTVNPSTGVTSFTAGATTVCQDAADETYTATAANSTGIVYSVSPGTAGTINATTGLMDWAAAFSGAATITATSTGLCGTTTANRIVTVNPSTGVTSFTAGATTVCQDAADETYTATAANSTGIVYSVSPGTAGTINATTGLMDWAAAFSGAATITATSTGLCGTTTANRIVTVNPSTGVTSFTAGATTVCQDAADETYTATAANSTGIVYSVSPGTAGTINATTGLMDWAAAFSGAATITATSTGLCGTTTANRIVTVNPSTGVTSFTAGATTVCQDAADETYTATAANSTGIVYSVSPGTAGTINATTGLMDWAAAFSGAATITATSTGLCGTTTANRIVTVNPSTGVTSFTAGATTVCQDAADETYTATAANSTGIVYSVSPGTAGTINATTGLMDWAAAFSGAATITATSTGLCGTTTANRIVTVNPSTGVTSFTAGATTVCQDAADETYTATAANSTGIVYSVSPGTAGTINATTGLMDWAAAFSGAATITATSTGLCGTTTANRIVTVNPSTGVTSFTAGATTVCQDAADETYTATAANSTGIVYSVSPGTAGTINATTGLMDWAAAFSGAATITATSTGLCGTTTANRIVTVNPSTGVTSFTAGATTVCQDAADETYTATAANSTGIVYSVSPGTAGTINATTGLMDWAAAFSGAATITATSTGLCGTTTANRIVTVNALPPIPTISPVAAICQNSIRTLVASTAVVWSPLTDLYTNATATIPYTGTSLATVYSKPTVAGSITYTATVSNAALCTRSSSVTFTVNPVPVITLAADYCSVAGKVRLTATTLPAGVSYLWSTGQTTSFIDVDIADYYDVVATLPTGCNATGTISVANELVVNGDFTAGNTGFITQYTYYPDIAGNSELIPDTGTDGYAVGTDGQNYHPNFYGRDHTNNQTGARNFMLVNGHDSLTIWQQTVSILPNTNYYFSAYGMNLNPASPAQLQFEVNGVKVGIVADLNLAPKPTSNSQVNLNNWYRFYSNPSWNSGTATTAIIRIVNLNGNPGGNDFGLDDISFGTLSTFVTLVSAVGTNAQTTCVNTTITPIVYYVGTGTAPTITGLPAGVSSTFNGVNVTITGTPTVAGAYAYTVATTGCNPFSASGTITVQSQIINLTSGSSTQTICKGTAISNIVYTASAVATTASITAGALPAGVTGVLVGNVFTISGTPTVAGVYNYTITTSGATCAPVSTTGSITVQEQTMVNSTGAPSQTICIHTALANIVYTVGGTGTGATITGTLPAGITGSFNSGLFIISGTPTVAGVFPYTVTSSGGCAATAAIASGTITVQQQTVTITTGNATQPICIGSPMANIIYNIGGSATGATVSGLPSGVAGTYSAGVFTISGTPTQTGVFNFTVTGSGGCTNVTTTGTLTIGINTWTGTNGTNWSLATNWSCGAVPVAASDVVVPTGVSNMPQLTATSVCRNLVLQAGATLDLNGQDFTSYGAITGPGLFKGSATSGLTLNAATVVSTINFDQTTDGSSNALKTLTVSGAGSSVTINNKAVIYDALLPVAGTLTLTDELILRSTATATARVGIVTGAIAYSANGKVTVERYLLIGRKWRLLSAPTNSAQTIQSSWLENGVSQAASPIGYGFWAADTRADWSARGFDVIGNNTSVKIYNGLTDAWDAVDNTLSPIKNNQGYIVFVPGDRKVTFPNSNPTTLRTKGQLYVGNQPAIPVTANKFATIGNPYASRIDLRNISKTNIVDAFYVWDPSLGGSYGLGAFNTLQKVGADYVNLLGSPIYGAAGTANNDIESGMAFMVNGGAFNGSITFDEGDKSTGSSVAAFTSGAPQGIRINLNLAGASPILLDGAMLNFDAAYSNQVDQYDIRKMATLGESVGLKTSNTLIVIERRFTPVQTDTLQIDMTKMRVQNYQWEIISDNMDFPGRQAFLLDRYLNTSTPLNMAGTTTVNFSIQNIPGSYAPGRFQIVFKIIGGGPVPVTITSVAANRNSDKTVNVLWEVQNEINLSGYEVQRSVDGINFTTIITQSPNNNNGGSGSYQVIDRGVVAGELFYRIKAISISGQVQYSDIVKVTGINIKPSISVYPNPILGKQMNVRFSAVETGTYQLVLVNAAGQIVYNSSVQINSVVSTQMIQLNKMTAAGRYQLIITAPDGTKTNQQLFLE